jgi:hypothetical protein
MNSKMNFDVLFCARWSLFYIIDSSKRFTALKYWVLLHVGKNSELAPSLLYMKFVCSLHNKKGIQLTTLSVLIAGAAAIRRSICTTLH